MSLASLLEVANSTQGVRELIRSVLPLLGHIKKDEDKDGMNEKMKKASDRCSSVALPLFRDGQERSDGYVPRLGKGPLWTTVHLG